MESIFKNECQLKEFTSVIAKFKNAFPRGQKLQE